MTPVRLAHCAQVEQTAEAAQVVGNGDWLSTGEAATIIGCSPSHVIDLFDGKIPGKKLPGTRVGNRRRILRTVVEAYRDEQLREASGES